MNIKTVKFPFKNEQGQTLAGLLDTPADTPMLYAVFAPCFTCTKESHGAHKISRALAQLGIAVLRFDHRGLGDSEGVFAHSNFTTRIRDILAASNALAAAQEAPKLLIGHSISGTAALAAASQMPFLQAVATVGAPADPRHVIEGLRQRKALTINGDRAEMMIAGRKFSVDKQMVEDMESFDMGAAMQALDKRLFIFHAPQDAIVPFRLAQLIYDRAPGDREIVPLSANATHLMEQGHDDAAFIAETLRGWADLHLQ